jgi:ribosome-binding factor A
MKHRKNRRDGGSPPFVDPEFADSLEAGRDGSRRSKEDHHAEQLCRQAQRALNLALSGGCGDETLSDLFVAAVRPAPGCGHLLVHVIVPAGRSVSDVLARLHRAAPLLREEVAGAITRKRAPELSFLPVALDGGGDDA